MPVTTVKNQQTAFDIAVQSSGAVEAVVALALLNNISITGELQTGAALMDAPVQNKKVVQLYKDESRFPATGDSYESRLEGIDYMIIEDDFLVY